MSTYGSSHCRLLGFLFFLAPKKKSTSICPVASLSLPIVCLMIAMAGCGSGIIAAPTGSVIVSPSALDFGDVVVGQASHSSVTVTNNSSVTIDIGKLSLSLPEFSVDGSEKFPIKIAPGGTRTFLIGFVPTAASEYSGDITFADAVSKPLVHLSVRGRAHNNVQLSAQLSQSASQMNFASVAIHTSTMQTLTLTATGTSSVTINAVMIMGAGFAISKNNLPVTLSPGQSVTVQVLFSPTSIGQARGQLTISSNASTGSTMVVVLSGTGTAAPGPQLTVSAGSLSFGDVTVNTDTTQALTLNSTGIAPVTIDSVAIAGAGFTLEGGSLPTTLNPSQTLTLEVRFHPTTTGLARGQLVIGSDSSVENTNVIALSGTGTAAPNPQLALSAGSLSFGNVTVNSTATQSLTLTSTGTARVMVNSTAITGAGFTLIGGSLPATLNPMQSLTLRVQFHPTTTGSASGQLTISSNASTGGTMAVILNGTSTAASSPQLTISAGSLSFGSVTVNTVMTQTLTLSSTGTAPVIVNSAMIGGAGFALAGVPLPATLNPTQSLTLQVRFSPTATGSANGRLRISSNSSTGSDTEVVLSGTSIAAPSPQLTVSAGSLSFGSVTVNTTTTQSLTLTSTGTAPVTVNAATVSGAGFSLGAQGYPITLDPDQSVTLHVRFSPITAGSENGQLIIHSDSSTGSAAAIALSGTSVPAPSPQLTVIAGSLGFGSVVANTSITQSLILTSTGTAPVTVNSATVSGAAFTLVGGNFPVTLNPTQSITLEVQFSPVAAGSANGQLTIISNSSTGSTAVVYLSGTGVPAPSHQLILDVTRLNFGSVMVNTSTTRSVTLTSIGTAPVTVNSAVVTGAGYSLVGGSLPATLGPAQSLTLQVQFDPASTGLANGQLTINSNSSTGATAVISLRGVSTAAPNPLLALSAIRLNFGSVMVNTAATQSLTLTSNGTSPVTVNAASISGTGFTILGQSFPTTLNPTQSITLQIEFSPMSTGSASGQITVNSNSTSSSISIIALRGTGTAANPQLTISPGSLNFGSVALDVLTTKTLTLTSTGTSPLTVNSAMVSGAGFALLGGSFPIILNPNQSLTLQLRFLLTTEGAYSGQVTISSNSTSGGTSVVALSGTGTEETHEIDLSWDAPTGSPVPVVGYNVYRSVGSSGAFRPINSSPVTAAIYKDNAVVSGATYFYVVKSVDASGRESSPSNQMTITIP